MNKDFIKQLRDAIDPAVIKINKGDWSVDYRFDTSITRFENAGNPESFNDIELHISLHRKSNPKLRMAFKVSPTYKFFYAENGFNALLKKIRADLDFLLRDDVLVWVMGANNQPIKYQNNDPSCPYTEISISEYAKENGITYKDALNKLLELFGGLSDLQLWLGEEINGRQRHAILITSLFYPSEKSKDGTMRINWIDTIEHYRG